MPNVVCNSQANRTAKEQKAAEWQVVEKYLDLAPGSELHLGMKLKDPLTTKEIVLTHSYIRAPGRDNDIFVKENEVISNGGNSTDIYLCFNKQENKQYIFKEFSKNSVPDNFNALGVDINYTRKIYQNEGEVITDLDCGKGFVETKDKLILFYKYKGWNLEDELSVEFDRQRIFDLLIDSARALHSFHKGDYSKKGIKRAHLDVKAKNYCVMGDKVSLIDFGCSDQLGNRLKSFYGCPSSLPNNFILRKNHDLDIFAFKRMVCILPGSKLASLDEVYHNNDPLICEVFNGESVASQVFRAFYNTAELSLKFKGLFDTSSGTLPPPGEGDRASHLAGYLILEKHHICNHSLRAKECKARGE
ncbi:Protein kinase domain protein [Piscirickettsia salmonis]|uniref:protein kinase family protein n=1 Tax=Piscirickettsia salmonis TaxID=1238 RepID=UPI0012B76E90|nr:protein kinase family protein [Piscirickettsia salmonis]QGP49609.1 Protein kinase domain protein [Piscirickettsia salmonis]